MLGGAICAPHSLLRRLRTAGGAHRRRLVALLDCAVASAATGWQRRRAGDFGQSAGSARSARVPTIEAGTLEDLFFAQGYVTAQDRLWQMTSCGAPLPENFRK